MISFKKWFGIVRLHTCHVCLYSTSAVCFQTRAGDLVIILFFLLENVITDGDCHLYLGSGWKYFNNWKLFPSVLLDAHFLRVTSLLIAACQICLILLSSLSLHFFCTIWNCNEKTVFSVILLNAVGGTKDVAFTYLWDI